MTPYYERDGITVYHGDCADVLPAAGIKADLILTSPPYGDIRTFGGYGFNFDLVADACVGALADGGVLVWQVGDYKIDGSETCDPFRQVLGFRERGLRLHDTMIFEKACALAWTPTQYPQAFEYMFVLSNGAPATANLIKDRKVVITNQNRYMHQNKQASRNADGARDIRKGDTKLRPEYGHRTNIWRYGVGAASAGAISQSAPDYLAAHEHPAIFPLALAKDHIRTWTNPCDVVLDPMAGSGTVLRAAKDLGRVAIGVEIHADYLPIITGRMAQGVLV